MTALSSTADPQVSTTIVPSTRPPSVGVTVMAMATRTVRKYVRTPQLLVYGIMAVAIFLVLFRYIFGGAIRLPSVPYVDFLVPGFVLAGVLIIGTTVAAGVAEDVEQGFFDRLRSLPLPRAALATGRVLGDTVVIAFTSAVTIALGFAVGFRLHGSVWQGLMAYALCVACGFAFGWIFVWMGLVAGNAQSAQGLSMIAYPIMFVSSAYVRVDTLPGWMQPIAAHQPITIMSNAVRSLALGSSTVAAPGHTTAYWVVLSLVWAVGIVAVFAPLATLRYRRSG